MNRASATTKTPRLSARERPAAERTPRRGRARGDEPRHAALRTLRGPLARYADGAGAVREVVAVPGAAGSVLVVDRDAATLGERRLVAHLAPEEPAANARLVCDHYLADASRGRCRAVLTTDLDAMPNPCEEGWDVEHTLPLVDRAGGRYGLEPVPGQRSIRDLRWVARRVGGHAGEPISVRALIGRLESYEPARAITWAALARHRRESPLSVSVLRAELQRVDSSRVVLNRGLREAVVAAMRTEGLSASEIAVRCGRIKRDARGNVAGETSWLGRRVGLVPEGGGEVPTPWIHSDVLGLIARRGLGLSPHQVELG
jgi:hypothetical protein